MTSRVGEEFLATHCVLFTYREQLFSGGKAVGTNNALPQSNLHFDRKLTWKEHIITERKQLDHKTREIKWLSGKNSPLSVENKLLIYKTIIKPIWTYGIVLWGCASKSNTAIMQRYQSKILRLITNAPRYVNN